MAFASSAGAKSRHARSKHAHKTRHHKRRHSARKHRGAGTEAVFPSLPTLPPSVAGSPTKTTGATTTSSGGGSSKGTGSGSTGSGTGSTGSGSTGTGSGGGNTGSGGSIDPPPPPPPPDGVDVSPLVQLPAVGVFKVCVKALDAKAPTCDRTTLLNDGTVQLKVTEKARLSEWQVRSSADGSPPAECGGAPGVEIIHPSKKGTASATAIVKGTGPYGAANTDRDKTEVTQDILGANGLDTSTGKVTAYVCLDTLTS
jgi:hypothetical protein